MIFVTFLIYRCPLNLAAFSLCWWSFAIVVKTLLVAALESKLSFSLLMRSTKLLLAGSCSLLALELQCCCSVPCGRDMLLDIGGTASWGLPEESRTWSCWDDSLPLAISTTLSSSCYSIWSTIGEPLLLEHYWRGWLIFSVSSWMVLSFCSMMFWTFSSSPNTESKREVSFVKTEQWSRCRSS